MFKQFVRLLCLLGALGMSTLPTWGQARSSSADLTGTIIDASKTRLRGAIVTTANIATGLTRTVTTDGEGAYRVPLLPPGQYEIKVQMTGFNTVIKKVVTLTV